MLCAAKINGAMFKLTWESKEDFGSVCYMWKGFYNDRDVAIAARINYACALKWTTNFRSGLQVVRQCPTAAKP